MLCVRMHVMPIKHWASAFFDLDSQTEYAGVAPPALAEMPEFTSGSGLLFLWNDGRVKGDIQSSYASKNTNKGM